MIESLVVSASENDSVIEIKLIDLISIYHTDWIWTDYWTLSDWLSHSLTRNLTHNWVWLTGHSHGYPLYWQSETECDSLTQAAD